MNADVDADDAGPRPPARWCEQTTDAGKPCPRMAAVLVTDFNQMTAFVCRDHWHHLHRTTGGAVRAVQILTRHHPGNRPENRPENRPQNRPGNRPDDRPEGDTR